MLKRANISFASIALHIAGTSMVFGVVALTYCPSACAQQATPFHLSAQKSERPSLTRADMELDGPTATSAPQTISYAQQPLSMGVSAQATPNAPNANQAQSQGQMLEYDVDWSRWIAEFADRWYASLRRMEEASGAQFYTVCPAQIHFTCLANGQIGNVFLKQSSGVPAYDRLQMIALSQVAVPPFPRGTKHTSVTLVQGWESHQRRQGESDYIPGSFGRGFPKENVREWTQKPVGR